MMIKKGHDEIWEWYQRIEKFKSSGMTVKKFCDHYEVNYKKFCNMMYRIEYKKTTNPELYAKLLPIARNYLASGAPASKFAKANEIHIRSLSEMVTHLGYTDIIENIKKQKENKPMQFVQVQSAVARQSIPAEHEILAKQNDIEIIISKGVKVSISPNVDSMKIIKIIELLKDL